MSYITRDDLETLFPDSFNDVTDESWEQTLASVHEFINGNLSARYAVPLSPCPALIAEVATDLARYELHDNLGGYDEDKNKGLKERYDYALKRLASITDGSVKLEGISQLSAVPSVGLPQVVKPARVFGAAMFTGF
jgi:phage gp36-like protein